jgi:selenocysteine lyase/cysteine desulfurase
VRRMAAHRRFVDELGDSAWLCTLDLASEVSTAACSGVHAGAADEDKAALLNYIYRSQIGCATSMRTAFGERRATFADYTASGRALEGIEDFIRAEVLPMYANTHTTASATGMQTTLFRAEARSIVRRALGCENNRDAVLFTGTGCTGAIGKMVELLKGTPRWKAATAEGSRPLVVVGPYEHHSNLLPWRESGCLVVAVKEARGGGVDMDHLESVLREHKDSALKIGTFSAASNLTGILCDTVALSVTLHRHKALAFFDYATAGPYTPIHMNPVVSDPALAPLAYKDAVFLSPHKFVGGVGTPGVLAFKKDILQSTVAFGAGAPPALPGGGTVFFVTEQDHRYLGNLEEREEAGTPDIVGAIRCGLAMRLKEAVGVTAIMQQEHAFWRMAKEAWASDKAIHVLGNLEVERLPIVSFNIRHGSQYLHHNFVAALLNDLFGIQVRAGCSCAGPYAQSLLGINYLVAKEYEAALLQGDEAIRPGVVRLNLNYFLPVMVVRFIIRAVLLVARDGWKLLPLYTFIPSTGEWRHRSERKFALRHRRWLSDIQFTHAREGAIMQAHPSNAGGAQGSASTAGERLETESLLSDAEVERYLAVAAAEAASVGEAVSAGKPFGAAKTTETQVAAEALALQSPEAARLRWFMLPSEAVAMLKGKPVPVREVAVCAVSGLPMPCVPVQGAEGGGGIGVEAAQHVGAVSRFEVFAREQHATLLRRQPHASFQEVLSVAGEAWRGLSDAQRQGYSATPSATPSGVNSKTSGGVMITSYVNNDFQCHTQRCPLSARRAPRGGWQETSAYILRLSSASACRGYTRF